MLQMGFYDRGLHFLCNKWFSMIEDFIVFVFAQMVFVMIEDFIVFATNGFL